MARPIGNDIFDGIIAACMNEIAIKKPTRNDDVKYVEQLYLDRYCHCSVLYLIFSRFSKNLSVSSMFLYF